MKKNYLLQVLIALDQLGNALLGGWADETMSARAYREQEQPRWGWLYRWLNRIQANHCEKAFTSERLRMQSPPEER